MRGRLRTRHQIQDFQEFSLNHLISCGMFSSRFFNFLQENDKIWLLEWRLGTRHQIQAFQKFFETLYFRVDHLELISCNFFTQKRLTLAISSKAKNLPSNPRISGIFLKYRNFLWNVLELNFFKFLPKKPQDLAIGLSAGNSISNQPFQEFCWNFLFSCGMI